MEVINISKGIEDFLFAKKRIEDKLIADEKITDKMTPPEFVSFLGLQKNIYAKGNIVIPFSRYTNDDIDYLFVACEDPKNILLVQSALNDIDYDFNNLERVNMLSLLSDPDWLLKNPYFLINGIQYKKKENK